MDSKLWIAFKVNAIHDLTQASSSFDDAFKDMTNELQANGIHLASLRENMRNVKSIGACSMKLQTFPSLFGENKMTQQIIALETKSNVDSVTPPLYIPIQNQEQDLPKAMRMALERTKNEIKCMVVIHEPRYISSKQIQQVLVECGEEDKNILLHPLKSRNENVRGLQEFLRSPNGIYVVPQRNFDGMESKCIVYMLNDNDSTSYNTPSIRSHISRAVEMLTIIHQLKLNSYLKQTSYLFRSLNIEPRFIECSIEMKYEAFKCNDPNLHYNPSNVTTTQQRGFQLLPSSNGNGKDKLVCYPCLAYCHRDHEQRSQVKLGASPAASVPGMTGMLLVDGARRIIRSIVGDKKCRCGETTTGCQFNKK